MKCGQCGKLFSHRSQYLIHISNEQCRPTSCNILSEAESQSDEDSLQEESDDIFGDDSDKDPHWMPSPIHMKKQAESNNDPGGSSSDDASDEHHGLLPKHGRKNDNIDVDGSQQGYPPYTSYVDGIEPLSSPVTFEQSATAAAVEEMMIEMDEDTTVKDLGMQPSSGKNKKGKKNFCKYCKTFQTKISRHFVNKHKDIPEIQTYINIRNDNKKLQLLQKRELCKLLISQSNKEYNDKVVNEESIEKAIPTKRSKEKMTSLSHVTCSECGSLISRVYFFSHKNTCIKRQLLLSNNANIPECNLSLKNVDPKYNILKSIVFRHMKKDKISILAQTDPLILEYGRRFLKGHMRNSQRNYVSSKIRTLADLVIRANSHDKTIKTLKDCVNPTNFDVICNTVKEWSQYNEQNGDCGVGSVPRRLCKTLKICSEIVWSLAIRDKNLSVQEQLNVRDLHEKFSLLMSSDWAMEVNSVGDKAIQHKKQDKLEKLPLEEDILVFCSEMKNKIDTLTKQLIKSPDVGIYNKLTQCLLAFLTIFNGRRPSEVTFATLTNYATVTTDTKKQEDLAVFKVNASKNGVRVPIVVPDFARTAINVMLNLRSSLNVKGDLIFSKIDGTPYNTTDLITKFKCTLTLKNPNDFSANGMRHYWATITQKHQDVKKYMPKYLGHTTLTHEKFYEMPLSDIHLNVIGPLLMDKCLPTNDKSETRCNTYELNNSGSEVTEIALDSTRNNSQNDLNNLIVNTLNQTQDVPGDHGCPTSCITPVRVRKHDCKRSHNITNDSSSDSESLASPIISKRRIKWITPEKEEIFRSLKHTIVNNEPPGRGKVSELWENSTVIRKRHSLQMLRIEVSKYHTKKKKFPSPLTKKLLEEEKRDDS